MSLLKTKDFYRFREKYIEAAKKLLPGFPNCVALHVRFFPEGHLAHGHNVSVTKSASQNSVDVSLKLSTVRLAAL